MVKTLKAEHSTIQKMWQLMTHCHLKLDVVMALWLIFDFVLICFYCWFWQRHLRPSFTSHSKQNL